jgi:hypothetical protein
VKVPILLSILGGALIFLVLWEAFEVILLPRRVTRKYRFTRFFYRNAWRIWSAVFRSISRGGRQETFLSYFGPLSLLLLLSIWAFGLIVGFALLHWASGSLIKTPEGTAGFSTDLYLSATTFFTLGLGDVTPVAPLARVFTAVEAGLGFGFLALLFAYLPALSQSISRREVNISLLDARAGSPPTAAEMLRRRCHDSDNMETLLQHLSEWERWAAELLESHLSYPVLAYFRSHHDNQSWLAAITAILDTSAFVMSYMEGSCARQAMLTFAMARHAVVDISLIFGRSPVKPKRDRLTPEELTELRTVLTSAGLPLREGDEVEKELTELRQMYEPYVNALSHHFRLAVPPWVPESNRKDNWETSAWERRKRLPRTERLAEEEDEHF